MRGRDGGRREFGDAESLAGHLLLAGLVFTFLAEHRQRLFPDEAFADLFASGRARPSIPADVIASVMFLQALHGLSDRQAAEAVTFDPRPGMRTSPGRRSRTGSRHTWSSNPSPAGRHRALPHAPAVTNIGDRHLVQQSPRARLLTA